MEETWSLQLLFISAVMSEEHMNYAGAREDTRTVLTWEQSLKTLM